MASLLFRNALTKAVAPVTRRTFVTTPAKRSADPIIGHIDQEAQPGKNLPFQIKNRYRLAALFIFYFGSGFSAPFLVVQYQLKKKSA